jgi:hypothetical protein
MLTVALNIERRGRWWRQRKSWRQGLPSCWSEVPASRRQDFFRLLCSEPSERALPEIARQSLGIPARWWRHLDALHVAALTGPLAWMEPKADASDVPVPYFDHRGKRWWMPSAKGGDLTCIQFLVADGAFESACAGDADATTLLLAALCRGHDYDLAAVPLRGRGEAEYRKAALDGVADEVKVAALLYFAGVKAYIHQTYGAWLFEDEEEGEDEDEQEEDDYEDEAVDEGSVRREGPQFGWYGVLQDVAETGVFGTLKDVQQAALHDVLVYLVRQHIKNEDAARRLREASKTR